MKADTQRYTPIYAEEEAKRMYYASWMYAYYQTPWERLPQRTRRMWQWRAAEWIGGDA